MSDNIDRTITLIMQECRNYYTHTDRHGKQAVHRGTYTLADGTLKVAPLPLVGAFVRIVGSILNDGVYQVQGITGEGIKVAGTVDETFTGAICYLSPPPDFVDLARRVDEFNKNLDAINAHRAESGQLPLGMLESESFEGYSYKLSSNKGGGGDAARKSNAIKWQNEFADELGRHRRMFGDKDVIL